MSRACHGRGLPSQSPIEAAPLSIMARYLRGHRQLRPGIRRTPMPTYEAPSREAIMRNYKERRNWGRWGDDDPVGAINLITVEKRLAALASVQNGRTVSLSRPLSQGPERDQSHARATLHPDLRPRRRRIRGRRRLLRLHLSRPHLHPHRRPLSHLGRGRCLAGPPAGRSDRLGDRGDLRRRDRLESGHLHPRRAA